MIVVGGTENVWNKPRPLALSICGSALLPFFVFQDFHLPYGAATRYKWTIKHQNSHEHYKQNFQTFIKKLKIQIYLKLLIIFQYFSTKIHFRSIKLDLVEQKSAIYDDFRTKQSLSQKFFDLKNFVESIIKIKFNKRLAVF